MDRCLHEIYIMLKSMSLVFKICSVTLGGVDCASVSQFDCRLGPFPPQTLYCECCLV